MVNKKTKKSALILVGGHGTRLRPFTFTTIKPLIPFANKPILFHHIDFLYKSGVSRIVLATSRKHDIEDALKPYLNYPNLEILFSIEDFPLGTAGPIKLAKNLLTYPCYVLNSDIICEFPLDEMMSHHQKTKSMITILSTKVKDPSKYGVMVVEDKSERVQCFIEKPQEYVGNRINAGLYIIEEGIQEYIKDGECSIEKEVFPILAAKNELSYFDLIGYWMDIGQPKDYLNGTRLYLNSLRGNEILSHNDCFIFKTEHKNFSSEDLTVKNDQINFYQMNETINNSNVTNSLIDKSAKIGFGCVIGPNVVIGKNVVIGNYVRLKDTTIFDDTIIGDGVFIKNSIVGWKCILGKWSRLESFTFLGSNVVVDECICLMGCIILPHKRIVSNSIDTVLM